MLERVDRLTDAQREVLRLVPSRRTAKAIAREIGITHHAVNERLRNARRTLGVASTFEAAQALAAVECDEPYKEFVYEAARLAPLPDPNTVGAPATDESGAANPADLALREERVSYDPSSPARLRQLPFPLYEGQTNELSPAVKLIWIVALAALTILSLAAVPQIATGLVRLAAALRQL